MKSSDKKQIYLVGAAKSGTTSIANNIGGNSQVTFNPKFKEPSFHARQKLLTLNKDCPMVQKSKFLLGEQDYYDLNHVDDSSYFIDASTCYLWYFNEVIDSINRFSSHPSDVYVIIVLRNPYERMYSQYLQMRMNDVEELDFLEALNAEEGRIVDRRHPFYSYLGYSLYYKAVSSYVENFPNTLVLDYERLKSDTEGLYREIFSFLDLDIPESLTLDLRGNKTGDRQRLKFLNFLLKSNLTLGIRKGVGSVLGSRMSSRIYGKLYNYNTVKSEFDLTRIQGQLQDRIEEDLKLCSTIEECNFVSKWMRTK